MQRRIHNTYKRTNVFHCAYAPHHRFEDDVSVYHVLKSRQCHPAGCVQFRWRCRQFDKGQKCPRRYQFVGRKCRGCKHYYEEKQGYHPELRMAQADHEAFATELETWEEWLVDVQGREVEFRGTIHAVKPHMKAFDGRNGGHHLRFVDWLLAFRRAIVGYDDFDDPIYVRVSRKQMSRHGFLPGMTVDGLATFELDRGRPVLRRFHRVEILDGSAESEAPTETEALVAASSDRTFSPPPEKCMLCERGILVDVEGEKTRPGNANRCLLCLEGMTDPGLCLFHLRDALAGRRAPATPAGILSDEKA
jgi:hypothetical protein